VQSCKARIKSGKPYASALRTAHHSLASGLRAGRNATDNKAPFP